MKLINELVPMVLLLTLLGVWHGEPVQPAASRAKTGTQDAEAAPRAGRPQSSDELELWRDPKFRRLFTESYLSETEIEPKVTLVEREKLQKVLDLMGADQMDLAATELEALRGGAASAIYDFMVGNIYFQGENLERAAVCYQVAVEKFPKFRRAWKNLGLIYVRQSEFTRAIRPLIRVIELGGSDAVTYGLLAYSYSNNGEFLAAESAYRMALMLDPETMDWKMGLARCLFKLQKYSDAAALCGQLITAQPDRTDLWLLQANAYIGLNQPRKAAENYELVDRMGKSTPDSLNTLADIYINDELYDLAVKCYARAMTGEKGTPDRALRAAKVLATRGATTETGYLLEQIESLHGEKLDASRRKDLLKLKARLAVASGAGEEEVKVLNEIVALDPLDGEALILLGQHAGRTGAPEQAVFYYERAASIEAFEADAKVRHAQLLVSQNKYNEALPLLRRAQAIKPRENIQSYLEQVERAARSR